MLMIPPSGGDTFVGNSGFTYTAATGVSLNVGPGDINIAIRRNWTQVQQQSTGGINSISVTLGAGPYNDLGASVIPGYQSGVTKRLIITAAAGGTTINGFDASGAFDDFTMFIEEGGGLGPIIIPQLATGSLAANRVNNANAAPATLAASGAARLTYVVNGATSNWHFA